MVVLGTVGIFWIVGVKLCWGLQICGLVVALQLSCADSWKLVRVASDRHC